MSSPFDVSAFLVQLDEEAGIEGESGPLKRPASNSSTGEPFKKPAGQSGPMKRPASNSSTGDPSKIIKKPAGGPMKRPAAKEDPPDSEQEDDPDKPGSDSLRDRIKSRKFASVYDSLPEDIKAAVEGARKDRSGASRATITSIINSIIRKDESGRLCVDCSPANVKEIVSKTNTKFKRDVANGIILEEAEAKVGGHDKLQAAILRGSVKKGVVDGNELFFFPKVSIGAMQSISSETAASKGKGIADDTYNKFKATLDEIGWTVCMTEKQLENHRAENGAESVPKELQDTLEKMGFDLTRSLKALDKAVSKVSNPEQLTATTKTTLANIESLCQDGYQLVDEIHQLNRFKKTRSGAPLTVMLIKQLAAKGAPIMQSVLENYKIAKGLWK